jgi:hypothetical protein
VHFYPNPDIEERVDVFLGNGILNE